MVGGKGEGREGGGIWWVAPIVYDDPHFVRIFWLHPLSSKIFKMTKTKEKGKGKKTEKRIGRVLRLAIQLTDRPLHSGSFLKLGNFRRIRWVYLSSTNGYVVTWNSEKKLGTAPPIILRTSDISKQTMVQKRKKGTNDDGWYELSMEANKTNHFIG